MCNQKKITQENYFRAYPRQLSVTSLQAPGMFRGGSILGFAERMWSRMKDGTTDNCEDLEDLRKNQMGKCVCCLNSLLLSGHVPD